MKCKHFFNLFEQSSLSKEFWKHLKSAVGQIIKSEVSHIRVDTDDIINKPHAMANALKNSLLLWPLSDITFFVQWKDCQKGREF